MKDLNSEFLIILFWCDPMLFPLPVVHLCSLWPIRELWKSF